MTRGFSRRTFLRAASAAALLIVPLQARAGAPSASLRPVARGEDLRRRLQPSAEALIAAARLDGNVGYCVANARTGEVLETHHAELGLPPASVAKALTAGYALAHLGGGHRFATQVLATGGVKDGVVQGDLVLAGGGDPTLDTDGLATLAARLAEAGITGVKGAYQVWGGALPYARAIDPEQPEHVSYNPAVSGLNLNYNRVFFEWRQSGKDYAVSMDARSERHKPQVHMARMAVERRSTPVYTYADAGGRDNWTVARGALGKGGARWLPVRKPELYAAEVFQSLCAGQGITLSAPVVIQVRPADGVLLAQYESALLTDILHDMLKWSTNLTAEVVGLSASAKRLGRVPASPRESAAALNVWAAETLGVKSLALEDHSGLGDDSRVKAADMMTALLALRPTQPLKPLLKEFLMRDAKRRVIEDHPISVHAKTGTLNFVSGLAGFADLAGGTELVFAIFAGNLERRDRLTKAERENPEGGSAWNVRAKTLQQKLIERWGVMYAET
ncbi:D-alanyl-D-alanine carboxypeptidase/D-alanyl-D-alanine endopeptidase [Sagittula salina]|uniref:D-alanyl-D-alanine carboxypeptidase/D-alanyl-D-alanine-endopeptidase n=1 Tax=Sagittula salina TaxID=2820268 RepID=A0A940S2G7_9RHOB|nr:D-alanyl-D-alanine carboxypeptidase/D-alanyl-D-alanine-endopeptidase [Sagittula salina]MBP0481640.1 D-alanyl-D-alanine carboxypeptidase/D-alanyl-D-alanine-endopeptidase [Sagittula salina]